MIGPKPTLQDIVLTSQPEPQPEPVDLMCHEHLSDSSEDEDEIDHHYEDRLEEQQLYRILSACAHCGSAVRLVVSSTHSEVQVLQQLLMGNLEIVCPSCAGRA
ncbi:E7 [Macaca fascicularis papillomavirus 6]|uniref:Protein E7 n=1 Tax=Macaca fascicularis papillomavirus 6 TaxID=471184 RepID=C3PU81_RHPV1|nr:E7 [Macaca fascicularis papillomavirus 6]